MTVTIASTTDTDTEVAQAAEATKEEFALTSETVEEASAPQATSRSDGASVAVAAVTKTEESPDAEETSVPDDSGEAQEASDAVGVEEEASETEGVEYDPVAAAPPDEDKPKRRRRGRSYKDRASQLAREKASEKLRADQLEVELLRLRNQQSSLARPVPVPAPAEQGSDPDPGDEAVQAKTPPDVTASATPGRPDQDSFDSYEDYAEALVEWKVDQKVDQKLQETEARQHESIARDRAQRAEETAVAAHTARIDAFRGEHEDFDAVITAGKDLPLSRPMQDAVVNSESGPALMYYLCQHPEECDRIAGMHPVMALKEMGKLEARVEAAPTGPVSSADSITKAPRPIQPVGGGATASTIPLDQMD